MTEFHLGLYMGHDTGLAVVDDRLHILHVLEEERFNGEKMTYFNPYFSLRELFRQGIRHFRTVAFGFDPREEQARFLEKFVRFQKVRCAEVLSFLAHHCTWDEIRFIGHHDCHAAGAFLPSPFDRALILVADGTGESESTSLYRGEGSRIERISSELTSDFSLGILYQYFTEWLGYRSHNTSQHCGKIMGLASYGDPAFKETLRPLFQRQRGADWRWPGGGLRAMRGRMVEALGMPCPRPTKGFTPQQAEVAAGVQALLEEITLQKLVEALKEHPFQNLCFAGGVAMNSQLNYRILCSGLFQDLFVQPLASDRGIALGAALASANAVSGERGVRTQNIYSGYGHSSALSELHGLLKEWDFPIRIEKQGLQPQDVARLLNQDQILALFQGRQEIGPRALGNRSILAAPSRACRDRTNDRVKYREPWRPFAPTVLEEEVGNYFDVARPEPFMTVIYGVQPRRIQGMEGIVHVDGTARLQTVNRGQNPFFYEIIRAYQDLTGIPVVLNTSFNINGQPIVRTVYDAIVTFLASGIDGLILEDVLIRKEGNLPREDIHPLDRILAEATRNARSLVIQALDVSDETVDLLWKALQCPAIRFRRAFGKRPVARCLVPGHTKMAWDLVSKLAPWVQEFVYGHDGVPELGKDEIGILVSGKHLIEASSRPTRTYVRFDRTVFREIIEACASTPCANQYFLLDRENHFFDMTYLSARFHPFPLPDQPTIHSYGTGNQDHAASKDMPPALGKAGTAGGTDLEREDWMETMADA